MGEKPVLNVQAHVFQIDPETKRKWLPSSSSSVRVAYYHDPSRKTYRIIAIESGKALVNSTVTANMTFTKTSPKFGQWSDHRANTVFGLGFASEKDLSAFADKFSEAKTAAKALLEERKKLKTRDFVQPPAGIKKDTSDVKAFPRDNLEKNSTDESAQNGQLTDPVSSPPASLPSPSSSPTISNVTTTVSTPANIANTTVSVVNGSDKNSSEKQLSYDQQIESLKFENSKLKVALASSAQNVKKWESEMQTLRNNNTMLTTALEESTQHVAEWKRQLQKYKEECDQLKKKVTEMEREKSEFLNPEEVNQIRKENEELKEVLSEVQVDLDIKREEVQKKEKSLSEMKENLKDVEQERSTLQLRNSELNDQLKSTTSSYKQKLTTLKDKHKQLDKQLSSVLSLHKELTSEMED